MFVFPSSLSTSDFFFPPTPPLHCCTGWSSTTDTRALPLHLSTLSDYASFFFFSLQSSLTYDISLAFKKVPVSDIPFFLISSAEFFWGFRQSNKNCEGESRIGQFICVKKEKIQLFITDVALAEYLMSDEENTKKKRERNTVYTYIYV